MTLYIEFAIFTSLGSTPLDWYQLLVFTNGVLSFNENTISALEPLRWCFLSYEGDYMGLFKEKDDSNLEDWQEKLVAEGKYDTTSFEEEELEEDDFYYEDNE